MTVKFTCFKEDYMFFEQMLFQEVSIDYIHNNPRLSFHNYCNVNELFGELFQFFLVYLNICSYL